MSSPDPRGFHASGNLENMLPQLRMQGSQHASDGGRRPEIDRGIRVLQDIGAYDFSNLDIPD